MTQSTQNNAVDQAGDVLNRNLVSRIGKYTLATAGGVAGLVGVSVAPRTTLGLTALGAGLVAAGNRKQLIDWGKSFKKDDAAPAATPASAAPEAKAKPEPAAA